MARRRIPLTAEQLALPRLDKVLEHHVLQVLEACGGNRLKAARVLRIDRKTLHRMLVRLSQRTASESPAE